MDERTEKYRREFYQEAREILEKANEDLLKAEGDPDDQELLNAIFRGIHTIKGSAGVFDLNDISEFTHHLEGILNALREKRLALGSDVVDVALEGFDHISGMVDAHEAGREASIDTALVERFKAISHIPGVGEEEGENIKEGALPASLALSGQNTISLPNEIRKAIEEGVARGLHVYLVTVRYTSELMENGYDPLVFLNNLKESSECYHAVEPAEPVPPLHDFEPLALYLHPAIYVTSALGAEEIGGLSFDSSLVSVEDLTPRFALEKDAPAEAAIAPETLREFVLSAQEMLESVEKAVMDFESTGSSESLNEVFRAVHNIKGDAGCVGLTDVTAFAHALESLLERLRNGSIKRTPEVVDILLQSIDSLRQSALTVTMPERVQGFPAVYARLQSLLKEKERGERKGDDLSRELPSEAQKVFLVQALQYREILAESIAPLPLDEERRKTIGRAAAGLSKACEFMGLSTLRFLAERIESALDGSEEEGKVAETVGEITAFIDGLAGEPKRIGAILVEEGKITEKDLNEALAKQRPIGEILVQSGKVAKEDLDRALKKQEIMDTASRLRPEPEAETRFRTMRVEEQKVEQFTNMIGELLIARNTYEYLLDQMDRGNGSAQNTIKRLQENLRLFSRLTNDMHYGVMSLRMVPIKGIFQKFTRIVRDISRKQKKWIDLIMDGEEVEVDKKVADMLTDPMVHIVRNACDHGIETTEERKAAGKPEKGTVILRAAQEGSHVTIKVIDDGGGINRTRLSEKAVSLGLEAGSKDDASLLDLIFLPGLSTKSEVTDISGRGVGMDVVKTAVKSLGGSVSVASEEGMGTEIALSIPMSMGIESALLVESGGKTFAFPVESIVETVKVPRDRLRSAGNRMLFYHRGQVLPADYLGSLLTRSGCPKDRAHVSSIGGEGEEVAVVVIRNVKGRFGVVVDRFIQNMEVAIKPVPDLLGFIGVLGGVSVMGDGKVLLLLNPEKLF